MPMTDSGMSAAILAKIQAIPGINITNAAELKNFCDAVAAGVVEYIQANATVPSGIAVAVNTFTGLGSTTGTGTVT